MPAERTLQAHAVSALMKMRLKGAPVLFAGDMGGNRRTPSEALWAKATGLVAGEPDLRVYAPAGRTLFLELKTATGRVSDVQIKRHAELRNLGHVVQIVRATTGEEMAGKITEIVSEFLQEVA